MAHRNEAANAVDLDLQTALVVAGDASLDGLPFLDTRPINLHRGAFSSEDQQAVCPIISFDRYFHFLPNRRHSFRELLRRKYALASTTHIQEDIVAMNADDPAL